MKPHIHKNIKESNKNKKNSDKILSDIDSKEELTDD